MSGGGGYEVLQSIRGREGAGLSRHRVVNKMYAYEWLEKQMDWGPGEAPWSTVCESMRNVSVCALGEYIGRWW